MLGGDKTIIIGISLHSRKRKQTNNYIQSADATQ